MSGLARQGLKPPPVGKGPERWASSHLTSASALYRPHTMGLGTTPAPPATPRLCTAGNQALPSTAGRGSSSPGPALINQPERGAGELRPWGSAPKIASETHTPQRCCVPERDEMENQGSDFQAQRGPQASCLWSCSEACLRLSTQSVSPSHLLPCAAPWLLCAER